jgi:hypothetical protein
VLATVDRLRVQAALARYIDEADTERRACHGRGRSFGRGPGHRVVSGTWPQLRGRLRILRGCKGENLVKRKDQRGGGERTKKTAARPTQRGHSPGLFARTGMRSSFTVLIVIAKLLRVEGP